MTDRCSETGELCGDLPLSAKERRTYLAQGLRHIARSLAERHAVHAFRADRSSQEVRSKIREGASPLRVYTCALAERIVPEYAATSGALCDLGCGGGEHRRFFRPAGTGRPWYVGVDVHPHAQWAMSAGDPGPMPCRFSQMSAQRLGFLSGSLGFTFSSSALEHVPDVSLAAREMARAMRSDAYGLHIVPGVWALFLYWFHGYRRFSPGGLASLFQEAGLEVVRVWALGGLASFLLHGVWISWLEQGVGSTRWLRLHVGGRMRAGTMRNIYAWLLGLSLQLDRWIPVLPAGYGVLVRKP